MKHEFSKIIEIVYKLYGGKKIELNYETPFQLLCAIILSAQTTDKQVNKITPPFFQIVRNPEDVIPLSLDEIENHLKYVNFYKNKSSYIKQTGEILAREYQSTIPNDLKLIQTFPGIGVKTAKVLLSVLYDMPYVGVDTHIHRVMNRIGIVETKTPEQTDKRIEEIFTKKEQLILHHPFVLFGRYHCTAKKPKCESCPIKKECAYYRTHSFNSL
ncbi:MAG: endonuclease III [Candidatus Altimarinota bacterium]